MAKYAQDNEALVITFTVEEILHHAVHVPVRGDGRWAYVGSLEDIFRFMAWRMVANKRPDIAKQSFAYGYAEVEGDTIKVTFKKQDIPEAPGSP